MGSTDESPGPGRYRFGDVVVDQSAHVLSRAGELRPIEPKAFAVLLALIERPGVLVPRDDLLDQVWGHRHVTPGVLTRVIAQLRSALGDDPQEPRYIQTRHGLGYVFVGELLPEPEDGTASATGGGAEGAATTTDPLGGATGAIATEARPDQDDGRIEAAEGTRSFHWRPRHWLAASLLAVAVFALSMWSARDDATPPAGPSIAVLPFTSLGPDQGNDYFAEGLAVEMHDALASVPGLVVAAQMSPGNRSAHEADVKDLGRRLGVATVLDASVRRTGSHLRINARLSDTRTGFTIWSNSYDREVSDVFATQNEIANEVVDALVKAIPGERDDLKKRLAPTKSSLAFDHYLKGIQQLNSSPDADGIDAAIGHFRKALEEDQLFSRAQMAICRSELARFTGYRSAESFRAADTACELAERTNSGSPEMTLLKADLHRARGEDADATELYAQVVDDPGQAADALLGLGQIDASRGRSAAALEKLQRASALRPGDARILGWVGYQLYLMGDATGAIRAYRAAVESHPDDEGLWSSLGGLYFDTGDFARAADAFERSIRIMPTDGVLANYAALRFQSGDYSAATTLFQQALEMDPGDFLIWGYLGDAFQARGGNAGGAENSYRKALSLAGEYLAIQPKDARALAAMAWYQANVGERDASLALIVRSDEADAANAEAMVLIAQAMTVVGTREAVLARIEAARRQGIPESRIRANPFLRRFIAAPAG